jgi:hypothetical protein
MPDTPDGATGPPGLPARPVDGRQVPATANLPTLGILLYITVARVPALIVLCAGARARRDVRQLVAAHSEVAHAQFAPRHPAVVAIRRLPPRREKERLGCNCLLPGASAIIARRMKE